MSSGEKSKELFFFIGTWCIFVYVNMYICLCVQDSYYFFVDRCVYEPCVMTTSCLDQSVKRTVKQNAVKLGGHVISEWTNDCTLVVMTSLSVTVKVVDFILQS